MNPNQISTMLQAMRAYGGGFVGALAEAWSRADDTNGARLEAAFPELVQRYGPGSMFFGAIERTREAS